MSIIVFGTVSFVTGYLFGLLTGSIRRPSEPVECHLTVSSPLPPQPPPIVSVPVEPPPYEPTYPALHPIS